VYEDKLHALEEALSLSEANRKSWNRRPEDSGVAKGVDIVKS
jgi:hypothetical protein